VLLSIKVDSGLIKFFSGDRYDLAALFKADPEAPIDFTSRNQNSLMMAVLS
jgi:hypothetical protein